jgi:sulfhydrogenase subunit beta (sulfur reductase)
MQHYSITKEEWDTALGNLVLSHDIFAAFGNGSGQDYEPVTIHNIGLITCNKPKPATPLKSFFLPVRENVTSARNPSRPRIIIGAPNCDIKALSLLDSIYLDGDFDDLFYMERRERTLLISSDCFSKQEHCHCMSYGIKPYASSRADLGIIQIEGIVVFRVITEKGRGFIKDITSAKLCTDETFLRTIDEKHKAIEEALTDSNATLPDYIETGVLISDSDNGIWDKYSSHCVSCGACSAICPTCSCFLLIEKPGFEKVKQMDSCQYPGFERVAGGEDALFEISARFKNRYLCKYVWKPRKFSLPACTGCGRCIETCIGGINKNELIAELSKLQ